MKKCIICGIEKNIEMYYVHKQMGDGRLNKCKDCCKSQANDSYKSKRKDSDWIDSEKSRAREKYHRLYAGKVKQVSAYEYCKKSRLKYPEKFNARNRNRENKALISGNHLHHWSYNEEHYKDTIELSVKDHNKAHRYMIYDQERMMYRKSKCSTLLDTKDAHIEYINYCIANLD